MDAAMHIYLLLLMSTVVINTTMANVSLQSQTTSIQPIYYEQRDKYDAFIIFYCDRIGLLAVSFFFQMGKGNPL